MDPKDVDLLRVIYGRPADHATPGELAAARRLLVRHGVTIQEARQIMQVVGQHTVWRSVIVTAAKLEEHIDKVRGLARAEYVHRPYDQKRPPPEEPLRPEQMFLGIKHPEMRAKRDALLEKILDAEARGFRGPALFREVLGYSFGLTKVKDVAQPAPEAEPSPSEHPAPLPDVFDLQAERAELSKTLQALADPAKPPSSLAHLPQLIRWCDANPEAGRAEFQRASVQLKTLTACGIAAKETA